MLNLSKSIRHYTQGFKFNRGFFHSQTLSSSQSQRSKYFTVSLIGRPNVGKSTLFNVLCGESISLVDKTPGLTRDRKEHVVDLFDVKVKFIDTAGVETLNHNKSIDNSIRDLTIYQTKQALINSDLAFFIVDSREGITDIDFKLAKWLTIHRDEHRLTESLSDEVDSKEQFFKQLKESRSLENFKIPKIILVANKAEERVYPVEIYEKSQKLNFGFPIMISAKEGDGMHEIYKAIEQNIPESLVSDMNDRRAKRLERFNEYKNKLRDDYLEYIHSEQNELYTIDSWEKDFNFYNKNIEDNSDFDSDNDIDPSDTLVHKHQHTDSKTSSSLIRSQSETNISSYKKPIRIALVGKQNVGKSTIINALLKDNRVIESEIPGTTRDSIPIEWLYKGRRVTLIDTAGLQKDSRIKNDKLEKIISERTINTIKYCHVIVYVIDSMESFTPHDLSIVNYIGKEGRAIIFVSNKWDLVSHGYKMKAKRYIDKQLELSCTEFKKPKILFISARTKYKVDLIMEEILKTYNTWNSRIPTKMLNQFISQIEKVSATPNQDGEFLNLKFLTQVKTRPPCFALFLNDVDLFFSRYENFLKKKLSEEFELRNVPIRFIIRDRNEKTSSRKKFKKSSPSTARIEKKIEAQKNKIKNITYLRRSKGNDLLHGRFRPNKLSK